MTHGAPWYRDVGLALDRLVNALLHGSAVETLSARAGRAAARGAWWGRAVCWLLDRLDPGHCERAVRNAARLRECEQEPPA